MEEEEKEKKKKEKGEGRPSPLASPYNIPLVALGCLSPPRFELHSAPVAFSPAIQPLPPPIESLLPLSHRRRS